jgi:hypothetical protein
MSEQTSLHRPVAKALSFSFLWDNLEAIVEWLEAIPDKGSILATIDTDQLKESAVSGFEEVFSKVPLTREALMYSGLGISIFGLSAIYAACVNPVLDPLHEPIVREIRLHPGSDLTINHLSVVIAATLRERVGIVRKFDLDEVLKKHLA